jgi:hypothetical protein
VFSSGLDPNQPLVTKWVSILGVTNTYQHSFQ